MRVTDILGRYGEKRAAAFLEAKGYEILDRNWRITAGEVDLIARDKDTIVVVEVKTRRSLSHGHPFEAINQRKLARLRLLAIAWLRAHQLSCPVVRIDVVGVLVPRRGPVVVEHLEGAAA